MSTPLADCPSDETLAKYLDDGLSPTVSGPLTAHIDGCPACQTKLDELTAGGGVSDRLKALSSVLERSAEDTQERGVVATTATDTQVFGRDGIPLVPRVQVVRPQVPGYEVDVEIGRGGMGVVFKAQHKRLNRTVALKMVLAAGVADPRVTQRFLFEAEVLAKVQHPQVVQVYEVNMFTAPTGVVFPYLAMELLPAGTLLQWVNGRLLAPAEAAETIEGLARAVHAVHQQGIVHRDLKPANILKSADGVFKVSDFGLAKLTAESGANLTGTGMVVGTPAYMAPEQAGGEGPIGPPADVYSLGAMLFELLTGKTPFPGDDAMSVLLKVIRDPAPDVRTLRPDVPRDLAAVVMKCLNKEAARRYQSADDLADDLKRFLHRRPTRARTLSAVERVWYWAGRNPVVAGLLSALAVVLTVGFVSTFILWRRAEGETGRVRQTSIQNEQLRKQAEEKSKEAEGERQKADRSSAFVLFDRAVAQCEAGHVDEGLAVFVRALALAEQLNEGELARVIRVNIAAWEREQYAAGRRVKAAYPFGAADFSPDGKWLIAADGDGVVRVYDADDLSRDADGQTKAAVTFDSVPWAIRATMQFGLAIKQPLPISSAVVGVAVDPTGRWAAACAASGRVVIWDLAGRKAGMKFDVEAPPGRALNAWQVAFTGDRLWVGADHSILHAFDPATGRRVAAITLPGTSHPAATAAVLGGTSFLRGLNPPAQPPDDGDEGDEGEKAAKQVAPPSITSVMTLRASPDGKRLFAGDRAGRVTEWDPLTLRLIATYRFEYGWVYGVAVSADGKYVAATGTDGTARLWPRQPGTPPELWRIDLGGAQGTGVALSADAGQMAVGDEDGLVAVYDTRTRGPVGPTVRQAAHRSLTIRPGGNELLLAAGGELRLTPMPAPPFVPVPLLPPAVLPDVRVRFLDYRPDGKALLVGCGGLWVCDPATGRLMVDRRPALTDEPIAGRFSADGTHILYGGRHEWGVLTAADSTHRIREANHSAYIFNLPARPTDTVAVRVRQVVYVHDLKSGRLVRTVWPKDLSDKVGVGRLMDTPDGREWRHVTADGVAFLDPVTGKPILDPATGKAARALKPGGPVSLADQTPDGRYLALLVGEGRVEVWDAERVRRVNAVPIRHRGAVTALAVSPDAKVVLTGGRDRIAQFFDADTGRVLGPRRTHHSSVTTAAYSPSGTEVAVGTALGPAVVWQAPPPPTALPLRELQEKYGTDGGLPADVRGN
jgi:WD40 repeat protein